MKKKALKVLVVVLILGSGIVALAESMPIRAATWWPLVSILMFIGVLIYALAHWARIGVDPKDRLDFLKAVLLLAGAGGAITTFLLSLHQSRIAEFVSLAQQMSDP